LESTKPPATPLLLGFNQATGPPQCSLDSIKPLVHPSTPWNQPSHRPPQYSLESTKPLATPVFLGFNQATSHPVLLGFNQVTGHPSAPLNSSKPPIHPSAPLDYPSYRSTLVLPWTHPSHRFTPVFPWTIQATGSFQSELFYSIAHVCNVVFTSVLTH
jgi:hypothetical protein